MVIYVLFGVLAGAVALLDPGWGLLAIAGLMLVAFVRDRSLALVLLLFAGRYREFPYAALLPPWVHASYFAAAFLLFSLVLRHRRDLSLPMPGGFRLPVLAHTGFGAWMLLLWGFGGGGSLGPYGTQKSLDLLLFSSLLLIVPAYSLDSETGLRRVLRWTAAVSLVLLGGSLFTADGSGRLAAFGGGPNVFGRFMGLAAIACLYELQAGSSRLWRWVGGVGVVLFTTATFLSGSRGASLSLVAVLGLLGLYTAYRRKRPGAVLTVSLAAAGALLALSMTPLAQRFALLLQDNKGLSVMARLSFAQTALAMFRARPLTGWAPGAFATAVGLPGVKLYPHNLPLEVLAEYGAIGAVLLATMLLSALFLFGRYARPSLLKATLFGWWSFALLVTQFSGDLFDSRIVWCMTGLCLALVRTETLAQGGASHADSLSSSVLHHTVDARRDSVL